MCGIGCKAHTQHILGYVMQCLFSLYYSLAILTGVRKIAGLQHVPTCTVLYSVLYTIRYPTQTLYGKSSLLQETRRVGLDIVNFYCHRHSGTFSVYYGYFLEELKERNKGRLKHINVALLRKAVVTIGGKNVRA